MCRTKSKRLSLIGDRLIASKRLYMKTLQSLSINAVLLPIV